MVPESRFVGVTQTNFNPQEATNTITVHVIFQIDKGTVTTLPAVILGFSALSGTNPQIHPSPKRNDEHPCQFPCLSRGHIRRTDGHFSTRINSSITFIYTMFTSTQIARFLHHDLRGVLQPLRTNTLYTVNGKSFESVCCVNLHAPTYARIPPCISC